MTPLTIQEIKTTNDLREMRKLLKAWVQIVDRYSTRHKPDDSKKKPTGDACWWYTERASIGALAGAAWVVGWTALEEYSTNKHPMEIEGNENKKAAKRGRCDLQIAAPKLIYSFEAKQVSVSIGRKATATDRKIKDALNNSFAAAKELTSNEASMRFAITFIVPFIPVSDLQDIGDESLAIEIEERFRSYLATLRPLIHGNGHALGAAFPGNSRTLRGPNGNRYYPGVIAVIRRVKRGNSLAKTDD